MEENIRYCLRGQVEISLFLKASFHTFKLSWRLMPPIGQKEWLLYRWQYIHIQAICTLILSVTNWERDVLKASADWLHLTIIAVFQTPICSHRCKYSYRGRITLSAVSKIMRGSYTQKHVQIQPSLRLTRVSYWWKYVHVEEVERLMTRQTLRVSYTPKCIEVRSTWQRHLSDYEGVFQVKVCTCRGSPTINISDTENNYVLHMWSA